MAAWSFKARCWLSVIGTTKRLSINSIVQMKLHNFYVKMDNLFSGQVNAMQSDILDAVSAEISRFMTEKDARAIVARLRREWGGESFYVRRIDRQARDATIRRELAAGRSIHAAAKAAGCSTGAARRAKDFLAL